MVKKRIDDRVLTLIQNGVKQRQRSVFVLVGDRGREQVVNLHYMRSQAEVSARPSVLWCYKKDLGFTTNRRKRIKEMKKKVKAGLVDPDKDDPFELFISATDIRWCYYNETHKVLGNTYGMCVLQDFEALTPNLLARTIETVEGGGIIVFLLRTVKSLKQLYTMTMDVHARYRTEAHQDLVARFNERFLLSLKDMATCLMLDDTLDVLPWARQTRQLTAVAPVTARDRAGKKGQELRDLQASFEDTQPTGSLLLKAKTLDQAKALLSFVDAISEKTLRSTVTLTAARGRGKSATLGLAMAAAVGFGYSNIFVTSPSPENLKTLFEFVFKGFDALQYQEHTDYEIIQSTNPDFNKAIVRVNVFSQSHRQTIQYIQPQDAAKLGQAELVVIDEAAAIPLPMVKSLLGPYLVFMASTVNGYEGTGRSLSLKLIDQLRRQSRAGTAEVGAATGARVLREITLEEPIRYAQDDPAEAWLNALLCLNVSESTSTSSGLPSVDKCQLYRVDRDALFSYNKLSEVFLQRVMSLYVASHYKNTPNDLQLLSDAPAHRIFCLLGPVTDPTSLPEILCVIQVALEGHISKESVHASLRRGLRASGDLIPWTVAQQFQDNDFASLSGARVVRIATHPDKQGKGYGKRALQLLTEFYEGKRSGLQETGKIAATPDDGEEVTELRPRTKLPPLLAKLEESTPEPIEYLGVSFGLTEPLLKFWKTSGFTPVYVRQTANDVTGEHTCIMLKPLDLATSVDWLETYWVDFQRRFSTLLGSHFRAFLPSTGLSMLERTKAAAAPAPGEQGIDFDAVCRELTQYDFKRLHAYADNMVDFHVVSDLVPPLARLWFSGKARVALGAVQRALLLGVGLQLKTLEQMEEDFKRVSRKQNMLSVSHLMALFGQMMRKFSKEFKRLQSERAAAQLPSDRATKRKVKALEPLEKSLADEESDEDEVMAGHEEQLNPVMQELPVGMEEFRKYAILADDEAFERSVPNTGVVPNAISVKRKAKKSLGGGDGADAGKGKGKKKRKSTGGEKRAKSGKGKRSRSSDA
eukprot:m.269885 g.269885  ORF g.269885 m.269885 type:complete len:1037 (-) comp19306_c0_seq8:61-3171(-)